MKGTISILLVLVAITCLGYGLFQLYTLERDISGWQDRAQVSSEPKDMHEYLKKVLKGMEDRGMTDGHAAIFFKTPANDMALIYRTVAQQSEQALVLTGMDRTSPEYQTGLDNLRGSIRELVLHVQGYWVAHGGWLVILLGGLSALFSILLFFSWLEE